MTFDLPDHLLAFVESEVAAGRYRSVSDFFGRLIDSMQRETELKAALQVGIDQADAGEFVEFTAQDIMREGRELLARRRQEGKKDGEAA